MMQPLVSIIIPCYNAADYVGEAIESALAQTYSPTEVIVIDDGSTDGSLDLLRSFGDRIRWETGPNRGACTARTRGLALAMGLVLFEWSLRSLGEQYSPCYDLRVPTRRVSDGPYKFVRHPLYIENVAVLSGIFLSSGSAWLLAPVLIVGTYYWRSVK